uniref:Uncharacterized protein n=1 Tax=Cucumis melo TaxID=3656 RepID=A0A9I9DXH7_CUCME
MNGECRQQHAHSDEDDGTRRSADFRQVTFEQRSDLFKRKLSRGCDLRAATFNKDFEQHD